MSTALTHSAAALPLLPASVSTATVAYLADQDQARALPMEELIPIVGDLLNGATLLMGHKHTLADLDDLDLMASGVARLIQRRFGSFKPAELSEAFQRGASGEYLSSPDEFNQVSLPCITRWLDGYQATARAQVVAQAQSAQAQSTQPLGLPAPRIDYLGSVQNYLDLAKSGQLPAGFELDLGNVLYTWLKDAHAFAGFRTAAEYEQMRQQETERLTGTPPASGADRRERASFLSLLAATGQLPDAHPLSRSVLNACKKRLLREWLHHHAQAKTNIVEFLTQRLAAQ